MMRLILLSVLPATLGTQAISDEFAAYRDSCEPLLTAIYENCSASHYYRCKDGTTYLEKYFFAETPDEFDRPIATLFGQEFEPVFQREMENGTVVRETLEVTESFSLSDLVETGADLHEDKIAFFFPETSVEIQSRQEHVMTDINRVVSGLDLQVVRINSVVQVGSRPDTILQSLLYYEPDRRLLLEGAVYALAGWRTQISPALTGVFLPDDSYFLAQPSAEMCAATDGSSLHLDLDKVFEP